MCERFLYDQLKIKVDEISSYFMTAYRKGYSKCHVLTRLNEN